MSQDATLPPDWIVGFTGHRRLHHPEGVAAKLREVLTGLAKEIPGQLVGHSSAAIGADTLFAEACLSLGIPWIALLPLAEEDFRSDFTDSDWAKARELLRQAARVETLGAIKDRNVAYLECGLATVEDADVMIAVWDGQPSRGTGGTAEVVAHARVLEKPLIILNPDDLSLARERFQPELFADTELNFLNALPDPGESKSQSTSDEPREVLARFFRKVDAEASRTAPRFRRWVAASVIMNTLAAILVAFAIGFGVQSIMLDAVGFILVAAAVLSIVQIKRKRAHQSWIRCRVAAEMCRSALATWSFRDVATPAWYSQLPEFTRLAKSIRLLRIRAGDSAASLDERRKEYLACRVSDQLAYFQQRSRRLQIALRIFTWSFWIFSAIGLGRAIFATLFGVPAAYPTFAQLMKSVLPIALPLAAGCALSLISIFDLSRQLESSRAMEKLLEHARLQLEKCENLSSLRRAIEKTENTFAAEFLEWFTLFKFPRFN